MEWVRKDGEDPENNGKGIVGFKEFWQAMSLPLVTSLRSGPETNMSAR